MVGQISFVIKKRWRGPPFFHPGLMEVSSTSDSINPPFIITISITFTPRLGYTGIQRRSYRRQEEKEEHKSARLRSLKSATSSKSRLLGVRWVQQGGVKGVRLRIYEPPVPLWEEDVNHPAAKEGQLGSLANFGLLTEKTRQCCLLLRSSNIKWSRHFIFAPTKTICKLPNHLDPLKAFLMCIIAL